MTQIFATAMYPKRRGQARSVGTQLSFMPTERCSRALGLPSQSFRRGCSATSSRSAPPADSLAKARRVTAGSCQQLHEKASGPRSKMQLHASNRPGLLGDSGFVAGETTVHFLGRNSGWSLVGFLLNRRLKLSKSSMATAATNLFSTEDRKQLRGNPFKKPN